MPRYMGVDTITFTDKFGNSYPVKEIREIPDESIAFEININKSDMLDEIASRKNVYGDGGEAQTYRLLDANKIKIVESKFDLSKIRSIKIPI